MGAEGGAEGQRVPPSPRRASVGTCRPTCVPLRLCRRTCASSRPTRGREGELACSGGGLHDGPQVSEGS